MTNMSTNFGAAADDYGRHRAGFPDSLFDRLATYGIGLPGQGVIDLGTGTGTLARGFARRGCKVIGIDPDTRLLSQAQALDDEAGVKIEYKVAKAEATGLASDSADVASAGQCWHWFKRTAVAREVVRILKVDGFVVIAHFDWLPLAGNVVEATERLIRLHNPSWRYDGSSGLHPYALRDLGEAGFRNIQTFSYDVTVPYSHEAWRGRIRASAGVGASLSAAAVARFDDELKAVLAEQFPETLLEVPHRVFAVVARHP